MNRLIVLLLALAPTALWAQSERSDIRHGNKLFAQGKYTESEKSYKSALTKNGTSMEAAFNLGAALYKQGRWAEAVEAYANLAKDGPAAASYNMGNACFQQRDEQGKLDEAIEHYKESLRRNPSDMEAKFNLAYAQKLKKDQNGGGDNDQNKDKDKNQDKNKDQQEQNQDQNKDDQNKDKEQNKDKQDQDKNENQQSKPQQGKQDAERMLKAIQAAENKTQEKVDAQKAKAVGTSRSSKDW